VPTRYPGSSGNDGVVSVGSAVSNDILWISCWPGNAKIEWINVTVEEEIVLDGPFVGPDWAVMMLPIHVRDCSSQQRIEIAVCGSVRSDAIGGEDVSVLGEHSEKEKIFTPSRATSVLAQKLGRNLKLARSPQVKEACDFAGRHELATHFDRRLLKPNLVGYPCSDIREVPRRLRSPLPH